MKRNRAERYGVVRSRSMLVHSGVIADHSGSVITSFFSLSKGDV